MSSEYQKDIQVLSWDEKRTSDSKNHCGYQRVTFMSSDYQKDIQVLSWDKKRTSVRKNHQHDHVTPTVPGLCSQCR